MTSLYDIFDDSLHMDESGEDRWPDEVLFEQWTNGNKKDVVAWFIGTMAERPGFAANVLMEFSQHLSPEGRASFTSLLPEDA